MPDVVAALPWPTEIRRWRRRVAAAVRRARGHQTDGTSHRALSARGVGGPATDRPTMSLTEQQRAEVKVTFGPR